MVFAHAQKVTLIFSLEGVTQAVIRESLPKLGQKGAFSLNPSNQTNHISYAYAHARKFHLFGSIWVNLCGLFLRNRLSDPFTPFKKIRETFWAWANTIGIWLV